MASDARPAQAAAGGAAAGTVAPSPSGLRVPDFFVVGHPKCGTTALYEMLDRHPQICMSAEKEPWFFSAELRLRAPPRTPIGIPDTLEDYLSLFAAATPQQRLGEASTTYLWSHTAAAAIAAVAPGARIIAILREPASFLRSLHLQFIEGYVETEADFGRALALEPDRTHGRQLPARTYWPQMLLYSEHVRYVEQLQRYRAAFPAEQLLVLVYEDFRAENEATMRRILRFLEVDDSVALAASEANPSVQPRSQRFHELVHAVSVGHGPLSRAAKGAIKAVTPEGLRRRTLRAFRERVVYAQPPAPDERLMAELRRRFAPEVERLSEYLDRDLVRLWGYEDVG